MKKIWIATFALIAGLIVGSRFQRQEIKTVDEKTKSVLERPNENDKPIWHNHSVSYQTLTNADGTQTTFQIEGWQEGN